MAGSEARDCHESTKLPNITRVRARIENVAMNETEPGPGVSIRQRGGLGWGPTISLMWVLCQFTSHRLDLGHHHLYYVQCTYTLLDNKLIYNIKVKENNVYFKISTWINIENGFKRKLILLMLLI